MRGLRVEKEIMRRLILWSMASALTAATNGISAQGKLPPCPGVYNGARWTNCIGKITRPSGDRYVGEFKNGKPDGQGTATFPSGEKYVCLLYTSPSPRD